MQSGHFVAEFDREGLAVASARAWHAAPERGLDGRLAPNIEQVWKQRHVAPVADFVGDRAFLERVSDGRGGDGTTEVEGGFEERAAEGQDPVAAGAGAFRKEDDEQSFLERGPHPSDNAAHPGTAVPVDENGAAQGRTLAEDGPGSDVAFGDEDAGAQGREQDDIEIAEVIGDQKAANWQRAKCARFEPEDAAATLGGFLKPFGGRAEGPGLFRNSESQAAARDGPGDEDEEAGAARDDPERRGDFHGGVNRGSDCAPRRGARGDRGASGNRWS